MATLLSYTQIGRKEDLTDKLIMLGDKKAPLMNSFKLRGKTHTMLSEWQDYTLATPTQNAEAQGFTPTGTYTARNLRQNYVQISQKPIEVADSTIEQMDVAGISNEWAFQSEVKFTELRRDLEWALIHNSASTTGSASDASGLALGMFGACTTNATAPTTSSSVLSEDDFINMIKSIYDNTGEAEDGLMCHTGTQNVKSIMDFAGVSKSMTVGPYDTIHNRKVTTIITAFGSVTIIPNIQVGNTKLGIFDMNTWAFIEKVPTVFKKLGRTGDKTTAYWKTEWSLHWLSERSNAVMTGLAA